MCVKNSKSKLELQFNIQYDYKTSEERIEKYT